MLQSNGGFRTCIPLLLDSHEMTGVKNLTWDRVFVRVADESSDNLFPGYQYVTFPVRGAKLELDSHVL